jgi:hypothetical protein
MADVNITWSPRKAFEVFAALGDYASLKRATGQVPSALLSAAHADVQRAIATFRERHPEEFEELSDQINAETSINRELVGDP